jgi:RecQ-mediated genome instability protein 1
MPPSTTPIPSIDVLLQTLSTQHGLHARPSVLQALLTQLQSSAHPPPARALVDTLKFRLLASDITTSLQPYANLCLPPTLPRAAPQSLTISSDGIVVQVLDIVDVTSSRADALDRLEMVERGETMRGREIVRVAPAEADGDGEEDTTAGAGAKKGGKSMHKLLLQDAAGRRIYGFELAPIAGVKVGMNIGAKILLKGCTVARGLVLLTPQTAILLGGKVEALHKVWLDRRKQEMKEEIEALKRLVAQDIQMGI